jgi:transitional endoplasmic reticulum ATPase
MTSPLQLSPLPQSDHSTSHVTIGRSRIGAQTDIVRIEYNNRRAFFYVDTETDQVVDDIGSNFRIAQSAFELFGGRGPGSARVYRAGIDDVTRCSSVTIRPRGQWGRDDLRDALIDAQYLVHPISESGTLPDGRQISFEVVEMEPGPPDGWNTALITPDTTFEWATDPEAGPQGTSGYPGNSSPTGGDSNSRGGGGGGGAPGDGGDSGDTITLKPTEPTESFDEDVAGLPDVKDRVRMLLQLFDPDIYEQVIDHYGEAFAERGMSMLMYGPPGCGKTLVAEAIAYEAKHNTSIEDIHGPVKFYDVSGSKIVSKYIGESGTNVTAAFDQASPTTDDGLVVLFFDEIETLVPDRSEGNLTRSERGLTNAFLREMSEVEENLFVIGATNVPQMIDAAAARRFPVKQFVGQPNAEGMAEVWRKQLSNVPPDGRAGIDFDVLGEASEGYTPAEIADEVLGADLKQDLVRSVIEGDPEPLDTNFLKTRLEKQGEPTTVADYLKSALRQSEGLEAYPELKEYVIEEAKQRGWNVANSESDA